MSPVQSFSTFFSLRSGIIILFIDLCWVPNVNAYLSNLSGNRSEILINAHFVLLKWEPNLSGTRKVTNAHPNLTGIPT